MRWLTRPMVIGVALASAGGFIACVGDDPATGGSPNNADAGGDAPNVNNAEGGGTTDAPVTEDSGSDASDAGVDSGPPGEVKWALGFGGSGTEEVNGIAVDSKGNAIIVGGFGSTSIDVGCANPLNRAGGGTITDYDVFVVKYSPDGKCVWAKGFSGAARDYASGVAIDPADDSVWVVGSTTSATLNVAGTNVTGPAGGDSDAFIAKLDSSGNYVTAKIYGSTSEDNFSGVAVASGGSVVVTGTRTKTSGNAIAFGAVTAAALEEATERSYAVVASFTSAGNPSWARTLRGVGGVPTSGFYVAVDKAGDIVVSGVVSGSLEPSLYPTSSSGISSADGAGSYDPFLAKILGSGTHDTSWAKVFGGPDDEEPAGVALDGNNNVFFTTAFTTSISFGGSALAAPGGTELAVAKYQPGGAHIDSKSLSTTMQDFPGSIAAASDGSFYVVGSQEAPFDFGTGLTSLNGQHDGFIAAYDATGKAKWVDTFGAGGSEYLRRVAVAGNFVWAVGRFESAMNIDGKPLTFAGGADVFVVKMNR